MEEFKGTKGVATIAPRAAAVNVGSLKIKLQYPSAGAAGCSSTLDSWAEREAHDKQLICGTFNVVTRTGLTPEQMEKKIQGFEKMMELGKEYKDEDVEKISDLEKRLIEAAELLDYAKEFVRFQNTSKFIEIGQFLTSNKK